MISSNRHQQSGGRSDRLPALPAVDGLAAAGRLPLLVTGIAGVAGFNAFDYFRRRYPGQVRGERRRDLWPLSGPDIFGCNLDEWDDVRRLFHAGRFRAVLSCGGSCKLKSCELDPAMARRVNVQSVANLLRMLRDTPTRLVHLSIDLVFSGADDGGYRENDSTDPVTVYGQTMVEAEQMIMSERPDACILRISLPMGISFNGHAGAIDWIQSRFKQGKPATLYFDEIRTPTYTDCLNRLFELILRSDCSGLFHAGGPRRLSLYEIAQIVNRVGGYDPSLLQGCPRAAAGPMPPRAGNVALDSTRLAQLVGQGPFRPWPAFSHLVPTDRDWHFRRDPDEPAGAKLIGEVLYRDPLASQR